MCNNGATVTDKSAHKQMIRIVMNGMYDAAGALTSVGRQMYEMISCEANCIDVIRERLLHSSVCAASDGLQIWTELHCISFMMME